MTSCKTQQVTVEKVITKTDTIFRDKVTTIEVPVTNTIEIESPCDSLGILKDFKQTYKSEKVYVTIQGKDNVITATINLDSIKQATIKEYRSSTTDSKEVIVETKYKTPKYHWYLHGLLVLSLAWITRKLWLPRIPKPF